MSLTGRSGRGAMTEEERLGRMLLCVGEGLSDEAGVGQCSDSVSGWLLTE